MIYTETGIKLLHAFNNPQIRTIVMPGGTSSGKTYSILELITTHAIKNQNHDLWSICSESLPHLKKGAIRDFKNITQGEKLWSEGNWNATDKIYKLGNKDIEFFSAGNGDTLRGSRRDFLFLNEANNISYEAYKQLMIRTRKKVIIDYNPSHDFWGDENLLVNLTDSNQHYDIYDNTIAHFISTYKDNHTLEQAIIDEIERMKDIDPEWYKVYGLGLKGSLKSAIYKNWHQSEKMPDNGNHDCLFLDFGFTNHPTAIGRACLCDGEIHCQELLYRTEMTNKMIAAWLKDNGLENKEIIAESAEPKSIIALRDMGIRRIYGVDKAELPVNSGIDLLRSYKIHITKKSLNAIKEFRFYKWKLDRLSGKYINVPIKEWDHFLDGLRYWAMTKITKRKVIPVVAPMNQQNNARSIYK